MVKSFISEKEALKVEFHECNKERLLEIVVGLEKVDNLINVSKRHGDKCGLDFAYGCAW